MVSQYCNAYNMRIVTFFDADSLGGVIQLGTETNTTHRPSCVPRANLTFQLVRIVPTLFNNSIVSLCKMHPTHTEKESLWGLHSPTPLRSLLAINPSLKSLLSELCNYDISKQLRVGGVLVEEM